MLKVRCPWRCQTERSWIVKVMLAEFLGLEYTLEYADVQGVFIEAQGRKLELPDSFFLEAERHWLRGSFLPQSPLGVWDTAALGLHITLVDPHVPVLFGEAKADISDDRVCLGLDIFGSAFFMLSRYEEVICGQKDRFDRFPVEASLVYQKGFLDRPIVNEYLEILWAAMNHLWPELVRKERRPKTVVSCDVDVPYAPGTKNIFMLLHQMGGDVFRRRNLAQAVRSGRNYFRAKKDDYSLDPFLNTFEWMMDVNESAGNRMVFYFIADHPRPEDGCYSLEEPVIRGLIKRIADRGHEIGLHASFITDQDAEQFRREADTLRDFLREEGVEQEELGSRQHFLRWQTPVTARNAEKAGMSYDATLSFANQTGFRCGTCYEYPFYDVVSRREMKIRERPLIVMDQSVFAYQKYSFGNDGYEVIDRLKKRCHQFDGEFTVLWHNYQFYGKQAKELYKEIIR